MGWRLRISHLTEVRYARLARASFNEARMTPLTLPTQVALESRVVIGAGWPPVPAWTYRDYWGSQVTVFDLPEAHAGLLIRATSTVETGPFPGRPAQRPSWDRIRDAAERGRLLEYTMPTPLTTLGTSVADGELAAAAGLSPHDAARAIADRVRDRVAFMPGATSVRTGAQEAWDKGRGVCQDIAHVAVSLLRTAGLPARYVSGYLHPEPEARPGATAAGQGHAWVEYWAGDWIPIDPTHGTEVAERHVVVARGRDYADVPPLKGVYQGPADPTMTVTVHVTRLA